MPGPDYRDNDPRGWCGDMRRGAAMGRSTRHGERDFSGAIYLRRVRLNSGGYDSNGTYFGTGYTGYGTLPLYWYASADSEIDGMLRARDRADARRQVLEKYPAARVRK